jgi:hypothetical protein
MLFASLLVGLITYYYFGQRPGVIAAVAAGVLFVVAAIVPGAKLVAYAIVGAGLVGVCLVGAKRGPAVAIRPQAILFKTKRTVDRWLGRRP